MRWSEELTLIETTAPAERTDAHGFPNPDLESESVVYANKKAVGQSEFYNAAQAGYRVDLKFDVHAGDYDDQEFAEFEGKRYRILRSYASKTGDTVELTLSDISEQRGGTNGGEVQNDRA